MTTIALTGSVDGFFHEVVGEAMKARRIDASDGTRSYLVAMLADYGRTPDAAAAMRGSLTLELDQALHLTAPAERFERLRMLGDAVLYASGFFHDHFEARGIDPRYVHGIGTRAYGTAASMLRSGSSTTSVEEQAVQIDVFGELAQRFDAFASVIEEIADLTLARSAGGNASSKGVLKVYERWLRTGSTTLAQALGEHGLVPMRGPKGLS